jgi:hypothetical protein
MTTNIVWLRNMLDIMVEEGAELARRGYYRDARDVAWGRVKLRALIEKLEKDLGIVTLH